VKIVEIKEKKDKTTTTKILLQLLANILLFTTLNKMKSKIQSKAKASRQNSVHKNNGKMNTKSIPLAIKNQHLNYYVKAVFIVFSILSLLDNVGHFFEDEDYHGSFV
jgi:hypothetical protein